MKQSNLLATAVLSLTVLALVMAAAVLPAGAQGTGTIITSAVFSIYTPDATGQTINIHRVTAPWAEASVTHDSFAGAYLPASEASFTIAAAGWQTATLTTLVQAWVNNTYPNYGILLEQGSNPYTSFNSSESFPLDQRPKLDVCYIRGGNPETCITIQRPGGTVADADIWSQQPTTNFGSLDNLLSGLFLSGVKQALLRFELSTPTAVALQSLRAQAVPGSQGALLLLGAVSLIGLVVWRKNRP